MPTILGFAPFVVLGASFVLVIWYRSRVALRRELAGRLTKLEARLVRFARDRA